MNLVVILFTIRGKSGDCLCDIESDVDLKFAFSYTPLTHSGLLAFSLTPFEKRSL
jgi:hypothetical protein